MFGNRECEWAKGLLDKLVTSYVLFIALVSVRKDHRQSDDEFMTYSYIEVG